MVQKRPDACDPPARRLRPAPAGIALAVFCAVAALYVLPGSHAVAVSLLSALGFTPFATPFLDTDTVLSALRCLRAGVDVYAANPCDPLGRVYDYSPLWLVAARLPVTAGWLTPVGLAFDTAFLAALWLLPPARRGWDAALLTLGMVSAASFYALERGNNDLVIFALAAAAARLSLLGSRPRWLGYAAALLAGGLKYYPTTLLLLAARERPRRLAAVAMAAACGLAAFLAIDGAEVLRALRLIPTGSPLTDMYGAEMLPRSLRELFDLPAWIVPALRSVMACGCLALGLTLAGRRGLRSAVAVLTEAEAAFLLAGAVLVLGSFFTAQNIDYRQIHLILVLPGLLAARRACADEAWRRLFGLGAGGALLLMWSDCWRQALRLPPGSLALDVSAWLAGWLLREAAWWGVVTLLLGLVIRMVQVTPTGRWLEALATRPFTPLKPGDAHAER